MRKKEKVIAPYRKARGKNTQPEKDQPLSQRSTISLVALVDMVHPPAYQKDKQDKRKPGKKVSPVKLDGKYDGVYAIGHT
jgi:hypothetical protein